MDRPVEPPPASEFDLQFLFDHPDPYPHTDASKGGAVEVPYFWEELTPSGAYGDARRATAAMGEELTGAFLERAGEFVVAFMREPQRRPRRPKR